MDSAMTLINEDWLRTQTWDIYRRGSFISTVDDLLWALIPDVANSSLDQQKTALQNFMTLPAWLAAPPELVKDVASFLGQPIRAAFDPDEARDDRGRWTGDGGGDVTESDLKDGPNGETGLVHKWANGIGSPIGMDNPSDDYDKLRAAVGKFGESNPTLYRGVRQVGDGLIADQNIHEATDLTSWSTDKTQAEAFAGNWGQVKTLDAGTTNALSVEKYLPSGASSREKEYIVDMAKVSSPAIADAIALHGDDLRDPDGGFTLDPRTGESPPGTGDGSGNGPYAVAVGDPYSSGPIPATADQFIKGDDGYSPMDHQIADFVRANAAKLDEDGMYLGGWHGVDDKGNDTGLAYLDVTQVIPPGDGALESAKALGAERDQIAITDLSTFKSINTGGSGEKKDE